MDCCFLWVDEQNPSYFQFTVTKLVKHAHISAIYFKNTYQMNALSFLLPKLKEQLVKKGQFSRFLSKVLPQQVNGLWFIWYQYIPYEYIRSYNSYLVATTYISKVNVFGSIAQCYSLPSCELIFYIISFSTLASYEILKLSFFIHHGLIDPHDNFLHVCDKLSQLTDYAGHCIFQLAQGNFKTVLSIDVCHMWVTIYVCINDASSKNVY